MLLQAQASRSLGPLSVGFVHTPMWQKLAPLALIFFCATFNHTLLVNMKARCPLPLCCPVLDRRAHVHGLLVLPAH